MRASIVDIGKLRAKAANIDWKLRQAPFTAEFIKHCKDLLSFSQRKNWYEDARATVKSSADCFCQTFLFTRTGPASRFCVVASRAFHDQDVNFLLRKSRRFHDRLIIEIDVPSVKDRLALRAQQNPT